MSLTFAKAPLVEIVVEMKWSDHSSIPLPVNGVFQQATSSSDEFFMRLGGIAYGNGLKRSERLVPAGFPAMLGQVVYRYKPEESFENVLMRSAIWQVGPGVFTANAIQPYKSWTEFSPIVKKGVEAVLEARPTEEKETQFNSVSLKYIDMFSEELMGGMSYPEFMEKGLGLVMELPTGLRKVLKPGSDVEHAFQMNMPVGENMTLSLFAGKGQANGQVGMMFITTVSSNGAVEANIDAVMNMLNGARDIIHTSFVEMTRPLHALMQPNKET